MGISTGEVLNDFPTSMVLDDQIFNMSVVAQHHLEARREILTGWCHQGDEVLCSDGRVAVEINQWKHHAGGGA